MTKPKKYRVPAPQVDWALAPPWAEFWAMDGKNGYAYWGSWGKQIDITTFEDYAADRKRWMVIEAPSNEPAPTFGWPTDIHSVAKRPLPQ